MINDHFVLSLDTVTTRSSFELHAQVVTFVTALRDITPPEVIILCVIKDRYQIIRSKFFMVPFPSAMRARWQIENLQGSKSG